MTESTSPKSSSTARWAMGIAIVSAIMAFGSFLSRPEPKSAMKSQLTEASKMKIHGEGTLNIGYIGTPPFTMINPDARKDQPPVDGFCVDLMNEIAERATPHIKIKWIPTTTDTLAQDLLNGKIDMVADPVFIDINRSSSCGFTNPICYFGIAHAVVRANDHRIKNLSDLNKPELKILLERGTPSYQFAHSRLNKAKLLDVQGNGDEPAAKTQVEDVVQGRVDAALLEASQAIRYASAFGDKATVLWLDEPLSLVPASFATRLDDPYLRDFLNTCMWDLESEGYVADLEDQWHTLAYYKTDDLTPGSGITMLFEPQDKTQSAGSGQTPSASKNAAPAKSVAPQQAAPALPKPYELNDKK